MLEGAGDGADPGNILATVAKPRTDSFLSKLGQVWVSLNVKTAD